MEEGYATECANADSLPYQDEAIVVYNYMHRSNSDLLDNYRADPNMRPPYCWHYIRPERQRWGVMEIWRNSGPVTRPLFDRGATHGEYGPNWVTGWLLYSVFRSRDIRNNRHRNQNKKDPGGGSGNGGSSSSSGGSSGKVDTFHSLHPRLNKPRHTSFNG